LSFGFDGNNPAFVAVYAFNSPTSYNPTVTSSTLARTKVLITGNVLWFKIRDDGTNLIFSVSGDGVVFTQVASFSRTLHMTGSGPDQVCWGANNQGSSTHKLHCRLVHWSYPENTPPNREQYVNTGRTTLNGGINDSQTSLSVTDGAVFPSTGNFRLKIDDEIVLCTERAGDTLTVIRGAENTTAAEHLNGAAITQVLTAGGLSRGCKDNDHFWDNPNRPPLARIVGAGGEALTTSSFSWVNQGSATVSDENGTIVMVAPPASGENVRAQVIDAPTPSYSIIAALQACMLGEGSGNFGICFRQSTSNKLYGLALSFGSTDPFNLAVYRFTSPTVFDSSLFARRKMLLRGDYIWFKLTDNGTNLIFYYSFDGMNWLQVASEGRGAFMTLNAGVTGPDQIGWYINNQGSTNYKAIARLCHWSYT
jgi:hypothetical protein